MAQNLLLLIPLLVVVSFFATPVAVETREARLRAAKEVAKAGADKAAMENSTASYAHCLMRVKSMSEKALGTRVKRIENAAGKVSVYKVAGKADNFLWVSFSQLYIFAYTASTLYLSQHCIVKMAIFKCCLQDEGMWDLAEEASAALERLKGGGDEGGEENKEPAAGKKKLVKAK